MIVDAQGQPLARTKTARAVVFVSADLDEWAPVLPYNVPEEIRGREIMGHMMAGEIVCVDESGPYYRAEAVQ